MFIAGSVAVSVSGWRLAKYAGLYFLSVLAVLVGQKPPQPPAGHAGAGVLWLCPYLPTWVWNISNGFVTMHLGENANLRTAGLIQRGGRVLGHWLGVAGPVVLVMLVFAARAGLDEPDRCALFVWPVLVIMTVQAVLKKPMPTGRLLPIGRHLLVSQMIGQPAGLMRQAGQLAVLVNLVICGGFIAASASGSLSVCPADPFRHLKAGRRWPNKP